MSNIGVFPRRLARLAVAASLVGVALTGVAAGPASASPRTAEETSAVDVRDEGWDGPFPFKEWCDSVRRYAQAHGTNTGPCEYHAGRGWYYYWWY